MLDQGPLTAVLMLSCYAAGSFFCFGEWKNAVKHRNGEAAMCLLGQELGFGRAPAIMAPNSYVEPSTHRTGATLPPCARPCE